jgi:hypothetical protein
VPGASQAGAWRTKHRLLTTNYATKSSSRRACDRSDEKLHIVRGALGNVPTNWSIVGTGDFNGDGKADIVWRDTAGDAAIWLMNGATISSAGGIGTAPTTWSIGLVGDYNGDRMSDLLWRDSSGNTAMWFMNGTTIASTASVGNVPTTWTVQSVNAE